MSSWNFLANFIFFKNVFLFYNEGMEHTPEIPDLVFSSFPEVDSPLLLLGYHFLQVSLDQNQDSQSENLSDLQKYGHWHPASLETAAVVAVIESVTSAVNSSADELKLSVVGSGPLTSGAFEEMMKVAAA